MNDDKGVLERAINTVMDFPTGVWFLALGGIMIASKGVYRNEGEEFVSEGRELIKNAVTLGGKINYLRMGVY